MIRNFIIFIILTFIVNVYAGSAFDVTQHQATNNIKKVSTSKSSSPPSSQKFASNHKKQTVTSKKKLNKKTSKKAYKKKGSKKKFTKKKKNNRVQVSLIMNARTKKILYCRNAHIRIKPASLTKLASIYVVFEKLKRKQLSLNKTFTTSVNASKQPRISLGLKAGDKIKLRELINALIIRSANDASVVLAEGISGSEKKFAALMNKTARKLGMRNTNFCNASGLNHRNQYTTARDLAKLSLALIRDFPQYYHLFKKKSFTYNNRTYNSHNHVTMNYNGAEGLKTGYVNASGYNLITVVKRGKLRLIGIVIGSESWRKRDRKMVALLDKHFDMFG